MTIDKHKLKALAEAANAVTTDVNITMAVGADPIEVKAVQDYLQMAIPKTILALLAEIEQLREAHEQVCLNYNRVSFASEERGKQIDQLKAENEALRKSIAGKVVCDLELLEDLRDSAAAEADQHRQSMGSYRPKRQEVLDRTVSRCDLLIAAAKEVSHG
ncbi:hypothetical protein [Pseudomonas juntendi]|uniref:hypothetical protein n=1 Tax=Pseudomonas juntendi TaxID=2666183 RepID=UPI0030CC0B37